MWSAALPVGSEMANGSCVLCYFIKLNRKPEKSGEVLLLSFSMGSKLWAAAWGCAGDAWGLPVRLVELYKLGSDPYGSAVGAFGGPESQGRRDLDLSFEPKYIFFFDTSAWPMPQGPRSFLTDVSLLFQEDFESGKVKNGTLLVRLDEATQAFFRRKPRFNSHYSALELDILYWLKDELDYEARPMEHVNGSLTWLSSQYQGISSLETYDRYIASAKYLLGPRRRFANLTLLRRGHGFCMDMEGGHEGPSFLCFAHEDTLNSSEECLMQAMTCDKWVYECVEHPKTSVRDYRPGRMGLGMVNDVEDCWPSCLPDVPQQVWQEMEEGLLFNARCADHQCRLSCCCNNVDLLEEEHAAEAANAVLISLLALMLLGLCCFNSRRFIRQNLPEQVIELTTLRPREPSSARV